MKARKLELRKMEFWTEHEDRLLRNEQTQHPYDEVASILKRTLSSVKARAITLKLDRKVNPWTQGELQALARTYGEVSARDIADGIGRTTDAVAQKALRAGIVKKPRWSEAEIKMLHKLSAHQTTQEIARLIGRSAEAVRGKLRQLGLSKKRQDDRNHDSPRRRPSDRVSTPAARVISEAATSLGVW
jgi:DNA-binding CsgD family transcriptional regulator